MNPIVKGYQQKTYYNILKLNYNKNLKSIYKELHIFILHCLENLKTDHIYQCTARFIKQFSVQYQTAGKLSRKCTCQM